ncbi:hypothetical protein PAXINDRAFT_99591 [Paxillus involutus ATCC 200175]|uniref:DUF6534 domain-containing protein n=1 Tax=Paxillus involutus ATCC 200175 TaxID=664439 RepID=A0A0C9U7I7_PAXIN|nr:hypothetical protein PAXINDRAFT_99591 [Paxillus involutus ATCC 200175]
MKSTAEDQTNSRTIQAPVAAFELGGALTFTATITPTAAELVSFGPASVLTAVQAVAAAVDITIASGLVYLLHRSHERVLKGQSRTVIQKLVILTINTGVWTALFAIFTFIIAFKNTLIYAALYFPLCLIYCNTVLANLNARELLKNRLVTTEVASTIRNVDPMFATPRNTTETGTQSTDPTISVQLGVSKSTDRDDYNESIPKER